MKGGCFFVVEGEGSSSAHLTAWLVSRRVMDSFFFKDSGWLRLIGTWREQLRNL